MTDYAELLATKSAELAELTKAFNEHRFRDAAEICVAMRSDFGKLYFIAADNELSDFCESLRDE